jgi:serine/threonine protein kinase
MVRSFQRQASDVKEISCASISDVGIQLGRKLGEGRFSEVVHGKRVDTGEEYAVKVIDQTSLDEDEEAVAALQVEVAALKRAARHPHIVALHSVIRTPEATYLLMELMGGGELFDAIIARGSFAESDARQLLRQLLSALAYCHALGVVHRDLKCAGASTARARRAHGRGLGHPSSHARPYHALT